LARHRLEESGAGKQLAGEAEITEHASRAAAAQLSIERRCLVEGQQR